MLSGTAQLLVRMKAELETVWEPLVTCSVGEVLSSVTSDSDVEYKIEWSHDAEFIELSKDSLTEREVLAVMVAGFDLAASYFAGQSAPLLRPLETDPAGAQIVPADTTIQLMAPAGYLWTVDKPIQAFFKSATAAQAPDPSTESYRGGLLPGNCIVTFEAETEVRVLPIAHVADWLTEHTHPFELLNDFVGHLARRAITLSGARHSAAYQERLEFEQKVLHQAIGSFTTVAKVGLAPGVHRSSNQLVNVAREVMEAEGLETPKEFTLPESAQSEEDLLRSISEQAGCFYRFVKAPDNWHRKQAGPMLAIWGKDRIPVALTRRSIRGYRARYIDEEGNFVDRKVTAGFAKELSPQLLAFYPSFPDRPLVGRDLWLMVKKQVLWNLALVLMLGFIGAMLQLCIPFVTGYLVTNTIPDNDEQSLLLISIGLTLAVVSAIAFYMVSMFALIRIEGIVSVRLTTALVTRVARLPLDFFNKYSAGDLMQRLTSIEHLRWVMSKAIAHSLVAGFFSLTYLIAIAYFSITLFWVSVVVLAVFILYYLVISILVVRHYRDRMEMAGSGDGLNILGLQSIDTIRVGGAESQFIARYLQYFAGEQRAVFRIAYLWNLNLAAEVGMPVISMAVFYMMYLFYLQDELAVGAFLGFFSAYTGLLTGMIYLGRSFFPFFSAIPMYQRIKPILKAVPESSIGLMDPGQIIGHVQVRDLVYTASGGDHPIIDGLDLEILPDRVNAVVGPSGCGKTTLVRILLRVLIEDSGLVSFDGVEAATLDPRSVRRNLGVVAQIQEIDSATIRETVNPGGGLSDEEIWDLLDEVGLRAEFSKFTLGLDTSVGPSNLSGGQQQRLNICVALATRPHFLILDQALSSLETQAHLDLLQMMRKRDITLLLVTQRLSSLKNVELIHYMDGGVIQESGSFAELMSLGGGFAVMARDQLSSNELAEMEAGA
jgi:ABC-type bacteriocin/lantibiotic exporter with double-glycine peptidase domain